MLKTHFRNQGYLARIDTLIEFDIDYIRQYLPKLAI